MGKIEKRSLAEGLGEDVERRLIANGCFRCNRQLGDREVKVLLPRYVQERDPYVSGGVVRRRFMCLNCYNRLRSLGRANRAPARAASQSQVQILC